eukprot:489565_1
MRRKLQSRNEDTISGGYNNIGEGCCRDVVSLSEELRNSDNVQLLRNRRSHVRNSEGFQEKLSYLKVEALGTMKLTSKSRKRYSSNHFLKYSVWIGWVFLSYLSSVRAATSDDDLKVSIFLWSAMVLLVLLSGLFSGLTLGLMSLDKIALEIVAKSDNIRLSRFAQRIEPLRKNGNLLLCTLLLGNVGTNALLSILLASQTSKLVGFAISTGVITVFGEIFPQAVCSRHALMIGSKALPIVKLFVCLFYPIAKPLAVILDCVLGEEVGTIHNRTELGELLAMHVKHGALDVETGREMRGVLHYKNRTVQEVMTPAKDIFMLNTEDKLSFQIVSGIFKAGFSRIPIYDKGRDDIVGILFTKDLVFADLEDEAPVRSFCDIFNRKYSTAWPEQKLGDVLQIFKQGRSHMAIVYEVNNKGMGDPFYEVVGIITLENIVEEIIGEIEDETDRNLQNYQNSQMIDMGRLALLNGASLETALSEEEAKAVSAHFINNVPQFKNTNFEVVLEAVLASPVLNVDRSAELGSEPNKADMFYINGEVVTHCTLILAGRMDVRAGKDGFKSDAGPWSVLAADALFTPPGSCAVDFTSSIASEHIRAICISHAVFSAALANNCSIADFL